MAVKNKKDKVDWYSINQVLIKRTALNLSQEDIASYLDVGRSHIGHIESPNYRARYTTTQLNELAKLFKCSMREFFPEKPL